MSQAGLNGGPLAGQGMTDKAFEMIGAEIARAKGFADMGQTRLAAQSFAVLRALIVDHADVAALRAAVAAQRVPLRAAREAFRSAVAGRNGAGRPLLILTDASVQPATSQGAEVSYACRLGASHGYRVDCIGQHLFTAGDVLAMLTNAPRLGACADVVVHIGQHDSAQPLLNQAETAAVGLLPTDLGAEVARFAAAHAAALTVALPLRHEVPVDMYRAQVTGIIRALRARGAGRIVVVTLASQSSTSAHNAALLQVARQADVLVLDLDRMTRHLPHLSLHWPETLHVQVADGIAALLAHVTANPVEQA